MFYAKNIVWGPLNADNSVTATFDLFQEDELVQSGISATACIRLIQQAIVEVAKGGQPPLAYEISNEEALGIYNDVIQNTELFFE